MDLITPMFLGPRMTRRSEEAFMSAGANLDKVRTHILECLHALYNFQHYKEDGEALG
jgi:hypothetical protein